MGAKLRRFLFAALTTFCAAFAEDDFLGAKCEKFDHSENRSARAPNYVCLYPHQKAIEAYQSFRNEIISQYPDDEGYKNLRVELAAGENLLDRIGGETLIGYYWKSEKELSVSIEYSDKNKGLDFTQNDGGTELKYYLYR